MSDSKKSLHKRIVALLLTMVLLVSFSSTAVFAADAPAEGTGETTQSSDVNQPEESGETPVEEDAVSDSTTAEEPAEAPASEAPVPEDPTASASQEPVRAEGSYTIAVDPAMTGLTISGDLNEQEAGVAVTFTVTAQTPPVLVQTSTNKVVRATPGGSENTYTFTMPEENVLITTPTTLTVRLAEADGLPYDLATYYRDPETGYLYKDASLTGEKIPGFFSGTEESEYRIFNGQGSKSNPYAINVVKAGVDIQDLITALTAKAQEYNPQFALYDTTKIKFTTADGDGFSRETTWKGWSQRYYSKSYMKGNSVLGSDPQVLPALALQNNFVGSQTAYTDASYDQALADLIAAEPTVITPRNYSGLNSTASDGNLGGLSVGNVGVITITTPSSFKVKIKDLEGASHELATYYRDSDTGYLYKDAGLTGETIPGFFSGEGNYRYYNGLGGSGANYALGVVKVGVDVETLVNSLESAAQTYAPGFQLDGTTVIEFANTKTSPFSKNLTWEGWAQRYYSVNYMTKGTVLASDPTVKPSVVIQSNYRGETEPYANADEYQAAVTALEQATAEINSPRNYSGLTSTASDKNLGGMSVSGIDEIVITPASYTLTTGGTVSITGAAAKAYSGSTIQFTSTNWPRVNGASGGVAVNALGSNNYSFTMPAENVTITDESTAAWDGKTFDTDWYNPNATTYEISTPAQLAGLAKLVNGTYSDNDEEYIATLNDFYGKTINLTADLDLGGIITDTSKHPWQSSGTSWIPIGGNGTVAGQANNKGGKGVFAGTFNGNGHVIENLYLNDWHETEWKDSMGLFGKVAGNVNGLTVHGYVYSNRSVGGVVGRTTNLRADQKSIVGPGAVENCRSYVTAYGTDSKGVGGIVGAIYYGSVKNCINYGDIYSKYTQGNAGGIAGELEGTIENCANYGTVQSVLYTDRGLGGIAGCTSASSQTLQIIGCVNYGEVKGSGSKGGILGRRYDIAPLEITNCYNAGTLSGSKHANGTAAGYNQGGIVAYLNNLGSMTIENCYNAGALNSSDIPGNAKYAIAGSITASALANVTIKNCYGLDGQTVAPSPYTTTGYETRTAVNMKTTAFVTALKGAYTANNGVNDAYGDVPILYWQDTAIVTKQVAVSIDSNIANGSITISPSAGSVNYWTRFNLTSDPAPGYVLKNYIAKNPANGNTMDTFTSNIYNVSADTLFSAEFKNVVEKTISFADTSQYTLKVTKTAGLLKEGDSFIELTTPKEMNTGEAIFEGDVLKVEATLKPGVNDPATAPNNKEYEYNGEFTYKVLGAELGGSNASGYYYTADNTTTPVSVTATPQEGLKNWRTLADIEWYGNGSGNNFELETIKELAGLAVLVDSGNTFEGKTVVLKKTAQNNGVFSLKDPVSADGTNRYWNAIGGKGDFGKVFKGTFNGSDFVLEDFLLFNTNSMYNGLFGCTSDATIMNITVNGVAGKKSELANSVSCGTIVGMAANTLVQNVTVNSGDGLDAQYYSGATGGIVGAATGHTSVQLCEFNGSILFSGGIGGGIVGTLDSTATIRFCVNNGDINDNAQGSNYTGGIVGFLQGSVKHSINNGTITGRNNDVGGIAGYMNNAQSLIQNCYNRGAVSSVCVQEKATVGGIVGYLQFGKLEGSYTTVAVAKNIQSGSNGGNNYYGNIIGRLGSSSNNTLTGNFFAISSGSQGIGEAETHNGVTGKTTADMTAPAFVTDLGDSYVADATPSINDGYPVLAWQVNKNVLDLTGFRLTASTTDVSVGSSIRITPVFIPDTTLNQGISWSSSNTSLATVDSLGNVTGLKGGTLTITATTSAKDANGAPFTDSIEIKVTQTATGLSLNPSNKTLKVGEKFVIAPTFTPSDTSNTSLTWASENSNIARVTSQGEVTGVRSGTVIIYARTNDGSNIIKTCVVQVQNPVTQIKLNPTSKKLKAGQTLTVTSSLTPNNPDSKKLTWTSDNPNVAKVKASSDGTKATITAVARGKAVITAKAASGVTAKCTITVTQPVTSIKLSKTAVTLAKKGKTATLSVKVSPGNANNKAVTWKSSKNTVVSVNSKGKLTAEANKGSATITATAKDGSGKKATCKVYIGAKTTKIKLNANKKTLKVGASFTLKATVTPSKAVNQKVLWSSSKDSVATVTAKGKVNAKTAGSATITAKTQDSGKKATCKVTVNKK